MKRPEMLGAIRRPVEGEMARYEAYLKEVLRSEHELAGSMLDYVFDNRGKALRPMLVMLGAGLYSEGRPLPDDTRLAAMLVEMVHTASLVHDDVIDDAAIRRGKPSAKAMWRSHRAVIIGDYILAKSFSLGMQSGSYTIVKYLSASMTDLCEGELLQSQQSDRLEMTRELYFEIIHKKTASLISVCAGAGALSAGAPEGETAAMREFGRLIGMAFQVKDDLLDYTSSAKTGKPQCGDLREKKITLPLLAVLEKSAPERRAELLGLLAQADKKPGNVKKLFAAVENEGGLETAAAVMHGFLDDARAILAARPASPCRNSLYLLCDYIADREG